jgi:hypothetical protein
MDDAGTGGCGAEQQANRGPVGDTGGSGGHDRHSHADAFRML